MQTVLGVVFRVHVVFHRGNPPPYFGGGTLLQVKPDAIIGVSGQKDSFNAEILQVIASLQERPVIFALSNPTTLAECTARDAIVLTEGRGLYGSGSPFPPVEYNGKTYTTGQGLDFSSTLSCRSLWLPSI